MIKVSQRTPGIVRASILITSSLIATTSTVKADFIGSDQYLYGTHDEMTGALLGPPGSVPSHFDMEFSDPGTLYLGGGNDVHRINANTGAHLSSFNTSVSFGDMEFMNDGSLMIAGNGHLTRFDTVTGQLLGSVGTGLNVIDMEFLSNGDLLLTDGYRIEKIDPITGQMQSPPGPGFRSIIDMELMDNGELLVAISGSLLRVDPITWHVFAEYETGIGSFTDMELLNNSELLFVGLDSFVDDGRVINPLTGQFVRDISIGVGINMIDMEVDIRASVVPIPAAVWLFGSGLIGLTGFARRKKS